MSLSTLAMALARNHLAHSLTLSGPVNERRPRSGGEARTRRGLDTAFYEPARVVVVIGAGASHHTSNLPVGGEAIKHLRRRLSEIHPQLMDEELDRLELENRLVRDEFETQLLALGRFGHRRLVEELQTLFGRRYYPSFVYEVLAHLTKHRFVDAIINFNFDETLDQALEDEIGRGHYYRVVSDSDCRQPLWDLSQPKGHLRLPLYVKPHGTTSSKSSLRFTRGDYFLLPPDLKDLLAQLIAGLPLRVLVIGHAMNSFEFNDILGRSRHPDTGIFVMTPRLRPSHHLLREPRGDVQRKARVELLKVEQRRSLDTWLEDLWRETAESVSNFAKPREIMRHRLIAEIFAPDIETRAKIKQSGATPEYFRDRTLVEVVLAVSKAKGFVHLGQLMQARAGHYFRLLKLESGGNNESLLDLCESVGLRIHSGDTLHCGQVDPLISERQRLIQGRAEFVRDNIPKLFNSLARRLSAERGRLLRQNRRLLERTLRHMYDGSEVEISISGDAASHEYFAQPIPLPTYTALSLATAGLLEKDWDLCLCVAETGEWLLDPGIRRYFSGDRRAALIVADKSSARRVQGALGSHLIKPIQLLRWWLHNQHMTLFLRQQRPLGGIFFERRLRASVVSPVLLEAKDAERAIDKFIGYWIRAEEFEREHHDPFVSQAKVEAEKPNLLAKLYARPAGSV